MSSFPDFEKITYQWGELLGQRPLPELVGILKDRYPELALKIYLELSKEYT